VAGSNVAVPRVPSVVEELDRMRHRISERAYERYRTSDECSSPDEVGDTNGGQSKEPAMTVQRSVVDDALLQRVYGEFLEMPGLRLTCRQAQRFWGLEESACLQLLEFLVDANFLCRPGHGMYTRVTDGLAARTRPRMATAQIDSDIPRKEKEACALDDDLVERDLIAHHSANVMATAGEA
jgi:hypothetical protein